MSLLDWLDRLYGADRLLGILALATLALLALALVFALLTVGLRLRSLRREIVRTRLEQKWEPLVLGVLIGDVSPADVRRTVDRRDALFFVAYVLRFVNRFVGDERIALRELVRPYMPLVASQLHAHSAEARARAVQTLVLLGIDEYGHEVVRALDDPSLTVAMVAARTLASREQTRFAPEILRRLHRFEHWSPLYLASLFSSMGSEVVPALRAIYRDPAADPLVRRVAADALHDLDDIGSADVAHAIAAEGGDLELVGASLHLLARAGGPKHAEVARRLLDHPNALLRSRAAEALGELGGEQDLLRLRAALDDASPWVALAAARALTRAGGSALLEELRGAEGPLGSLAREVLSAAGRAA